MLGWQLIAYYEYISGGVKRFHLRDRFQINSLLTIIATRFCNGVFREIFDRINNCGVISGYKSGVMRRKLADCLWRIMRRRGESAECSISAGRLLIGFSWSSPSALSTRLAPHSHKEAARAYLPISSVARVCGRHCARSCIRRNLDPRSLRWPQGASVSLQRACYKICVITYHR